MSTFCLHVAFCVICKLHFLHSHAQLPFHSTVLMVGAEFFCIFCLQSSSNRPYLIPACAQTHGLSNLCNESCCHSTGSCTLGWKRTWVQYQPGPVFCLEAQSLLNLHSTLLCSVFPTEQAHLAAHGFWQDSVFSLLSSALRIISR